MATNILPLPTATAPTRAFRFVGMLANGFVAIVHIIRRRHELQTLAGFDDRMLADIGLSRGDLRDAVAEPLWRDPTAVLVTRVHERRSAYRFGRRSRNVAGRLQTEAAPPTVPDLESLSNGVFPARSRYY